MIIILIILALVAIVGISYLCTQKKKESALQIEFSMKNMRLIKN